MGNESLRDGDLHSGKHTDGSTLAEQAHRPTPRALQAQTLADDARLLAAEVVAMRATADALARRTVRGLVVVAVIVVLIAVGGVLLYRQSVTTELVERTNACQARQNDAFRASSVQLRDAAMKERTAQRKLLDVALDPNASLDKKRAASVEYYAGLVAADQQRNANPLPTDNCGQTGST